MGEPQISRASIFVDANVWLYAIIDTQDPEKARIAKQIISNTPGLVVSTQTINEVCVNIVKNKFLDEPTLRGVIDSFYVYYRVIDLTHGIIRKASAVRERYAVSYWDSLVLAAALMDGCQQILSEDMQDGLHVDNQLLIVNPFKKNTSN
jgi:predicted nucleic acid-binding protein